MDDEATTTEEETTPADTAAPSEAAPAPVPVAPMTKAEMRAAAGSSQVKQEDIDTPFWPALNGQLAIRDVPTPELNKLQKAFKSDTDRYMANMLCKTLVSRHTGERVFEDDRGIPDESMMLGLGGTITIPLMEKINEFFGYSKQAVAEAKKN